MPNPDPGLHETLITEALSVSLGELDSSLHPESTDLSDADAPDRIAHFVSRALRRAVEGLPEKERAATGIRWAKELIEHLGRFIGPAGVEGDAPVEPGKVLRAIHRRLPSGSPEPIEHPLLPLLDTTLLTNAPDEPRVGSQLRSEISSADRIDVVMAFIRRTGIRPLLEVLRRHCEQGRGLRILTTTYTNSTELAALKQLSDLGAEVRVSYDTSMTRLHAKAWVFHRASGFHTAYVGSSNLTYSAQQSGLEWNVRLSAHRNPDVLEKVAAVFDSYWHSVDFRPFDPEEFERLTQRGDISASIQLSPIEITLFPFQERLLEQVAVARAQGRARNLLVSATGTGKTVMAAVDYQRLRERLPRARLLFVAHRKEILEQTLATFRHALRDGAFGELWVGGQHPSTFEHVFASIQSLNSAGYADLAPDHFDVVIIDEFHHAAADSYRALLEHIRPVELLGLTATPERADGLSVLQYFDDRIAAELRLWQAIDQHRLCPFLYYGISDGTDLRDVPWRRGRGYDVDGLTNILTANDSNARQVLQKLVEHVDNIEAVRCLGFCVSVDHARFMARVFREAGVRAAAISGQTAAADRRSALEQLDSGQLQVLFSVDLFNEGVDVPTVDTLLFLRPTDSATLFLQQLGRGLRKSSKKTACTVLDFVGQHRREFRFDRRFAALFEGGRKRLEEHIKRGFPFLPAGCHMELDAVARDRVLANIKAAVPSHWAAKAEELRRIAATQPHGDLTLRQFLEESDLALGDVYQGTRTWSDLRASAGLANEAPGPQEELLRRACGRILHVNDHQRIGRFREFLQSEAPPDVQQLSERDRRLMRMLVASITAKAVSKDAPLTEGTRLLWDHPQVRAELIDLLEVLAANVDHLHRPISTHPDAPVMVHARYSRVELLAAFGVGRGLARVAPWQTGVRWIPEEKVDLLAFTLDKSSGGFSPTTRYKDYAITPDLIHWESQGVVRANSATGRRYQGHAKQGSTVLLFARLRADDRSFWCLGPATYVRHESERPMQVTWRLEHSLPGDLFAAFAAAVA